jgi:hypothetical protein
MSNPNRIFAACAIAALLLTLRASADDAAPESPAPTPAPVKPALKATLHGGETVGTHQVQRAFLDIGTNKIVFIVPNNFWMDGSNPQKIVLTKADKTCFITVSVGSSANAGAETSVFKQQALSRYPGAKITGESTEYVANHSGPAFTLEWSNASGVAQTAHISFIPSAAGVLEFNVLARSADFKDARNYFDTVLSSVQNNESGKLVIVPLPDFS